MTRDKNEVGTPRASMEIAGGRDTVVDGLEGICPSCISVGFGYRDMCFDPSERSVGVSWRFGAEGFVDGDGGGGEMMRGYWREMEMGRDSGRDEDDEGDGEWRTYGEEKGGNKNRGCRRDVQSGRREKFRWRRIECRDQDQQEKLRGKRMREQSEPSLSFSPIQSGGEAALDLANKRDEERSLGFLHVYRRFCPVLNSAERKRKPNMEARWDSDSDSDHSGYLPTPCSQTTNPNKHPRLSLRGGAGSKGLAHGERVPKVIWFFAGGVGRAPTGKGLREWKEKARKKGESGKKEKVGFWGKIGLRMARKGKKRKHKIKEERKKHAEGAEGAEGVASGAQAADGDVAPGGSGGEAGAAPSNGEGAEGEGDAQEGAAINGSGSGSGRGSSSSDSSSSGRAE